MRAHAAILATIVALSLGRTIPTGLGEEDLLLGGDGHDSGVIEKRVGLCTSCFKGRPGSSGSEDGGPAVVPGSHDVPGTGPPAGTGGLQGNNGAQHGEGQRGGVQAGGDDQVSTGPIRGATPDEGPATGPGTSSNAARLVGEDQIQAQLPADWLLDRSPMTRGIRGDIGNSAYLSGKVDLADKNWMQWMIVDGAGEGTQRMQFFTNPQLNTIIRYQADLTSGAPVFPKEVFPNGIGGKDIVMGGWRTDAQAAGVPESSLRTLVAQDLQQPAHQQVLKDTYSENGVDPNTVATFNAAGDGQAGFQRLTNRENGLIQAGGMDSLAQTYGPDLGGKHLSSIEAYLPTSKPTPADNPANVYAIIGTLDN